MLMVHEFWQCWKYVMLLNEFWLEFWGIGVDESEIYDHH